MLSFADEGVQARFPGAAEKRSPQLTERLKRAVVLPELNPAENKASATPKATLGVTDCGYWEAWYTSRDEAARVHGNHHCQLSDRAAEP